MTIEERFEQINFSQFSKIKDILLMRLKLRRDTLKEEISLEELDEVSAAGNPQMPEGAIRPNLIDIPNVLERPNLLNRPNKQN